MAILIGLQIGPIVPDFAVVGDGNALSGPRKPPGLAADAHLPFKTKLVAYRRYSRFPRFLNQPLPPIDSMEVPGVHLVMLYRPPPRRFLKEALSNRVTLVFLLHGVSLVSPQGRLTLAYLFQLFVRCAFTINRRLINRARVRFQALTPATKAGLVHLGIESQLISVIPNELPPVEPQLNLEANRFIVVYLGRMERAQKGLDLLSKIVEISSSRLPAVSFEILGTGRDLAWFQKRAGRFGNVRVRGFVTEGEKLRTLESAALLVCTSTIEPFSLSVAEGLSHGLSIVSTAVDGPIWQIGDNPLMGEIVPSRAIDFVLAIEKHFEAWFQDPVAFRQAKLARRDRFLSRTGGESMAGRYLELIRESARAGPAVSTLNRRRGDSVQ